MNIRRVLNLLGKVLMLEGGAMLPALLVSLIYREPPMPLLLSALACAAAGFPLSRVNPGKKGLRAHEGLTGVALSWILLSAFGALPYLLGGYARPVDSFFESTSGLTTTGATIFANIESLPRGILFWRSFTNWIGGMGVLVLTLALIPRMDARSVVLLRAETTGPAPNKIVPRIGNSSRITYLIYLGLSIVQFALLLACGMGGFDAAIHMFGTAGTGGFSNYNASVGHFANPAIHLIIATFLLLFGVNFTLYFHLLQRNVHAFFCDEELRVYLGTALAATLIVAANVFSAHKDAGRSLLEGYFQVASILTTAGFATVNYNLWPELSRMLLLALMLIGGCAGSTGGGMKVIRVTALFKSTLREIKRAIHPRGVAVVKLNGRALEEGQLSQILAFFFAYMLIIILAALVVSLDNFSLTTSLSAAVAAVSNIGPGLDMVGPVENYARFSPLSKLTLTLCMIVGRLELYPVLILFSRHTWKDVRGFAK